MSLVEVVDQFCCRLGARRGGCFSICFCCGAHREDVVDVFIAAAAESAQGTEHVRVGFNRDSYVDIIQR